MRRMTGTKLMATSDRGRKVAKRGEKKVRRRAPAPHWLKLALRRLAFATALGLYGSESPRTLGMRGSPFFITGAK